MGRITTKTTVNVSPSEAYKYVSDPRNAPRFISAIRHIESGPTGAPAEGLVWRAEAEFMGKARHINLKLAEIRPGKLVRYTISGDPDLEITLSLRPANTPNNTEIELTVVASSIPTFLMNAVLGNMLAGDLRRLKGILERDE